MITQTSTVKTISGIILSVLFCCFVFSSSINMLFTEQLKTSRNENRSLAALPIAPTKIAGIKSFFSSLDNYLNDHFGYREHYIYRYQRELKKHFGQFSLNDIVVHGLNNWLFFNSFNLIKDFLGLIPLTDQDLEDWIAETNNKANWFKAQGIHYLYIVAPNKQTIYPKYVMKRALLKKGISRYEQMVHKHNDMLPNYMIDLQSLLKSQSESQPLYYKYDTHWNKLGAYLSFQELMKPISAWYPETNFTTSFSFQGSLTSTGGDLARLILQNELTETTPQIKKIKRCEPRPITIPYALSDVVQRPGRKSFIRRCNKKNLKILVFRDSFFNQIEPFISQNFAEVVYLWKDYDKNNISEIMEYYKPDIVIEEIVERHMFDHFLKKRNPKKKTQIKTTKVLEKDSSSFFSVNPIKHEGRNHFKQKQPFS